MATVVAALASSPVVVLAGTVYAMQAQLALALAHTSGYVVGLDDGFALWSNKSLPARLFVDPRGPAGRSAADEMFVTAQRSKQCSFFFFVS